MSHSFWDWYNATALNLVKSLSSTHQADLAAIAQKDSGTIWSWELTWMPTGAMFTPAGATSSTAQHILLIPRISMTALSTVFFRLSPPVRQVPQD